MAAELDGSGSLRRVPPDWFHVTVTELGSVVDDPDGERELSPAAADRIEAGIGRVVEDAALGPFDLAFPRLNCWPTVVFAEVEPAAGDASGSEGRDAIGGDRGPLVDLHRRVLDVPEVPRFEYGGRSYTPHVTLAHFVGTENVERVVGRLESNRTLDAGPLRVESVELVADDPTAEERSFETVREYPL